MQAKFGILTLLVQHGWEKSGKIDRGLATGTLSGIVLSPRDENPASLAAFTDNPREDNPELTVFVDPQHYTATVVNPPRRPSARLPLLATRRRPIVTS